MAVLPVSGRSTIIIACTCSIAFIIKFRDLNFLFWISASFSEQAVAGLGNLTSSGGIGKPVSTIQLD